MRICPLFLIGICALVSSGAAGPDTAPEAGQTGTKLRGEWCYPVLTRESPVPRRGLDVDPRRGPRIQRSLEDEKDPAVAATMRQLQSIIVPKIEFRSTSRNDAIEFLRQEARRLDPEHRGLSIFLKIPAEAADVPPASEPKITLTASDLSLAEALRQVAAQVGMKVRVEPYAVAIVPTTEQTDVLATRAFVVTASFFDSDASGSAEHLDARQTLETKGITFPPGSSATYLPSSKKLVVRNTKENIDLVEKLLPKTPETEE